MPVDAKPLFRPAVVRNHVSRFKLPKHVELVQPKLLEWANLIKPLWQQADETRAIE